MNIPVLSYLFRPIRRMYDWTVRHSSGPRAKHFLAFVSFADSSFFPIPPDVALIPVTYSDRQRAMRYATICTVASVLGGMFGYLIGYLLYASIGIRIIQFYHLEPLMQTIGSQYERHAFLTVFLAAFTPLPYKLITISAGLFKISFLPFILASAIGRGGRFFLVALLIRRYGEKAKLLIEEYFEWFAIVFAVLLIGGFFALHYIGSKGWL